MSITMVTPKFRDCLREASPSMWTWESISPGRRVQPAPSIVLMPRGGLSVGPTAIMVPSATVTVWSVERAEPSNRSACVIAKERGSTDNLGLWDAETTPR